MYSTVQCIYVHTVLYYNSGNQISYLYYYYYFITTLLLLAHYVLKSNIIQNRDSCILGYHTEAISAITRVYV